MRLTYKTTLNALVIIFLSCISYAQNGTTVFDLSKIGDAKIWKVFNREVSVSNENENVVVHFNSQAGDGFAKLENFEFANGTIEIDIKGKDVQGNSFVGVVFRGLNDSTFDAVYFRPFNFMSNDSVRKSHSVQYISEPVYTWEKLRREYTGKYENQIKPAPDPNSFFHAKIVVEKPKVSVFVNNSNKPCLVVNELSNRVSGWLALWVGNYSEGTFANLEITKNN